MGAEKQILYFKAFTYYRFFSVLLCSAAYGLFYFGFLHQPWSNLLIPFGMITACVIGNRLYREVAFHKERKRTFYLIHFLETLSYGLITYISGGPGSPYLWYSISCVFLMILLQDSLRIVALTMVWYLLCVAGRSLLVPARQPDSFLHMNVTLGLIVVSGVLVMLMRVFHLLAQGHEKLLTLTEQLRVENDRSKQAFAQMSGLYDISLEEHSRITDEIHDTVIQKLFGIVCRLRTMQSDPACFNQGELLHGLSEVETSIVLTMRELREALYGRNFQDDAPDSFAESLERYLDEAEKLHDIQISTDFPPQVMRLSAAQKITLYRTVCEAVNNAVRHGQAEHISIALKMTAQALILTVADDGIGFEHPPAEGNGLRNLHKMAGQLGGTVSMESGETTKMTMTLSR